MESLQYRTHPMTKDVLYGVDIQQSQILVNVYLPDAAKVDVLKLSAALKLSVARLIVEFYPQFISQLSAKDSLKDSLAELLPPRPVDWAEFWAYFAKIWPKSLFLVLKKTSLVVSLVLWPVLASLLFWQVDNAFDLPEYFCAMFGISSCLLFVVLSVLTIATFSKKQ